MTTPREAFNGPDGVGRQEDLRSNVPLTVFFEEERAKKVDLAGGKGASLAELRGIPGIKVPDGFVATTLLSERVITQNPDILINIEELDRQSLHWLKAKLNGNEAEAESWRVQYAEKGEVVKEQMEKASLVTDDKSSIVNSYQKLSEKEGQKNIRVAVRSSGATEDGSEFSFAGQNSTFLHQEGEDQVISSTIKCIASQFGKRVIQYRNDARLTLAERAMKEDEGLSIDEALAKSENFSHIQARLATVIQVMADGQGSGIGFSVDSASGAKIIKIDANYGLGEAIVGGAVTPDSYEADPKTGAIIGRTLGEKGVKTVYIPGGTEEVETLLEERGKFAVSDEAIVKVAKSIAAIKNHYGKEMDTEFVIKDGEVYFTQARPETVSSGKDQMIIKMKEFAVTDQVAKTAEVIMKSGRMGSPGATTGEVMSVESLEEAEEFLKQEGNKGKDLILVTKMTTPDWVPVMKKVKGIITRNGGANCHAAIVCREKHLPCIVGAGDLVKSLKSGDKITIDARNTAVYRGELPLKEVGEDIDVRDLIENKTKITKGIILADPDEVKILHALAELGENFKVSLLRAEFLLSDIGVHVNALVDYHKGTISENLKGKVAKKLAEFGYTNAKEYFIAKYSEGISKFAALFPNSEVVLRTTDYKTNEYKELVGGREYETDEENPMMGQRGLPRFLSPENQEGFEWELEAIKRARDKGFKNIEIMFPMVRSPREMAGTAEEMEKKYGEGFRSVKDIMKNVGLERGKDGLKVLIMVENPANVIMLDEFIDTGMIDEISIGSNDLTQFVLAVDRDNEWLGKMSEYNELNPAVVKFVKMTLETCKRRGIKAGICGNAPSNHPEFARMLVQEGISSIGVAPDRLLATHRLIREEEKAAEEKDAKETILFNASSQTN
jgi:pyruvate, water dikinase